MMSASAAREDDEQGDRAIVGGVEKPGDPSLLGYDATCSTSVSR